GQRRQPDDQRHPAGEVQVDALEPAPAVVLFLLLEDVFVHLVELGRLAVGLGPGHAGDERRLELLVAGEFAVRAVEGSAGGRGEGAVLGAAAGPAGSLTKLGLAPARPSPWRSRTKSVQLW